MCKICDEMGIESGNISGLRVDFKQHSVMEVALSVIASRYEFIEQSTDIQVILQEAHALAQSDPMLNHVYTDVNSLLNHLNDQSVKLEEMKLALTDDDADKSFVGMIFAPLEQMAQTTITVAINNFDLLVRCMETKRGAYTPQNTQTQH